MCVSLWSDLKFLFERFLFSVGMVFNLILNIILIPYYLVRILIKKPPKELVIIPKQMKQRLDMYGKLYKGYFKG